MNRDGDKQLAEVVLSCAPCDGNSHICQFIDEQMTFREPHLEGDLL